MEHDRCKACGALMKPHCSAKEGAGVACTWGQCSSCPVTVRLSDGHVMGTDYYGSK